MSRYDYRLAGTTPADWKRLAVAANQRKGRCGRIAAGVLYPFIFRRDFTSRPSLPSLKFCVPTWRR